MADSQELKYTGEKNKFFLAIICLFLIVILFYKGFFDVFLGHNDNFILTL